jgi:hypothetical protein
LDILEELPTGCVDLVFKFEKLKILLEPHIYNDLVFKLGLIVFVFKVAIPSVRFWSLSWSALMMLLWIIAWQTVSVGSFCLFKIFEKKVR